MNHNTITGYDFTKDEPLPRQKAVWEHCQGCRPDNHPKTCEMASCELHKWRSYRVKVIKGASRTKDVRKYCLGCSGGSRYEIAKCEISDCTLWPYRNRRNPVGGFNDVAEDTEKDLKG